MGILIPVLSIVATGIGILMKMWYTRWEARKKLKAVDNEEKLRANYGNDYRLNQMRR